MVDMLFSILIISCCNCGDVHIMDESHTGASFVWMQFTPHLTPNTSHAARLQFTPYVHAAHLHRASRWVSRRWGKAQACSCFSEGLAWLPPVHTPSLHVCSPHPTRYRLASHPRRAVAVSTTDTAK